MSKSEKKLNAMEQSIIDGLNGVTSRKGHWKLFSSRYVSKSYKLTEREQKLYQFIIENCLDDYTKNNAQISINSPITIKNLKTRFIDWSNEKLIENVSVITTEKEIEHAIKNVWKEYGLSLNRTLVLCCNDDTDDNNIYIASVSRDCNIYKYKNESSDNSTDKSDSSEIAEDTENLLKINTLLNSVSALAKDFDDDTKKEIVNTLANLLNVSTNKAELLKVEHA